MTPIKLFPFNADKSYLLSLGSIVAKSGQTLEAFAGRSDADIFNQASGKKQLPFIVAAGVGNSAVYVDESSDRLFYILESKNGYFINGLTTDAIKAITDEKEIPQCPYNRINVKNGDFFSVPKCTPFGAENGVSYLEVYTSCGNIHLIDNVNFLRKLSVTKSAPLLKKPGFNSKHDGFTVRVLYTGASFTAALVGVIGEYANKVGKYSFNFLFCLDGGAYIKMNGEKIKITAGESYILPAGAGEYKIEGAAQFILLTR